MKRGGRKKAAGGISMGKPGITTSGRHSFSRFFVCFFLSFLGSIGAFGCFYSGFSFTFPMGYVIAAVAGAALLFSGIFFAGKNRALCTAAVLILFLWSGFFLRASLQNGVLQLANGIIQVYSGNSGFDLLPIKTSRMADAEIARVCTITAAYVMVFFTFFLAFMLTARKKRYFLCIAATVPFFGASLVVEIVPEYVWILLLFLYWALLLCDGASLRGAAIVVLPVTLVLALLAVGWIFPKDKYERSDFIEDLRVGVSNGADISAMLRGGGIAGTVNRVDLMDSGDLEFTGKTMLKVRTAKTTIDYLKGFVGSVYTGESWEPLSENQLEELEAVSGDYEVQNFPYWFTKLLSCPEDSGLYSYDLTVRNVGTNPRCVYMPYGLMNLPGELPGIEFAKDTGLRSGNTLFGTQEYRVQAISFSENHQYMGLYFRLWTRYMPEERRNGVNLEALGLSMYSFPDSDKWEVPDELLSVMNEEQKTYIQTVEDYRDFVYEAYTQVPEELEDFLNEYRKAHDLTLDQYYFPAELARAVTDQIQSENTYTLTPGLTPEGRDFVEYFLSENHQGYCRHFASATALLLRSAGVPARYVEGYAVSPNAEKDENGWILLADSNAHAWVEIYVSGMGWMPIETTGSVRDDIPLENEAGKEDKTENESSESEETRPEKETEARQETSPSGAGSNAGGKKESSRRLDLKGLGKMAGWTAAAVLLMIAAVLLNRRLRTGKRRKEFLRKNRNLALLAAYQYILEIKAMLDDKEKEELKEIEGLALKARFSQHPITKEELQRVFACAETYREKAAKTLTGGQKLYGKYIKGLF